MLFYNESLYCLVTRIPDKYHIFLAGIHYIHLEIMGPLQNRFRLVRKSPVANIQDRLDLHRML